jgi:5-(carboxyamino)imidazole ribonucleotide synthase
VHTIDPGGTIGILGSGQLGRMLALAARRMGYRVHVFSPERQSPTGQVADVEVSADYHDLEAVRAFARKVDVITFEFENVPAATAAAAAEYARVRPDGRVLHTTQNRRREKEFLTGAGLPVTPFVPVDRLADVEAGLARLGCPAVLKTAAFGYDGKGQVRIDSPAAAGAAWQAIGARQAVLEAFVPFEQELSVVAARGQDGAFAHYSPVKNRHHRHILDVSLAPALLPGDVSRSAVELARAVLEALDVVGVLCVEYFLTRNGRLLINELAPRPHNSGHLTIDACHTSQFEQQLRAVCGLPLGSTQQVQPAAMANLLGDLWQNGPPNWPAACAFPGVNLHLYGKLEARSGRKMGHLTAVADSVAEAERLVLAAREALRSEQ